MSDTAAPSHDSPFVEIDRDDWAELAPSTRLPLSETELVQLRGLGDVLNLREVSDVYLPLSRLLNLYVAGARDLHRSTSSFLGERTQSTPFVIGIAGSVAVGKSTIARLLRELPGILESRRILLGAGRDRLVAGLAERFPDWQVPKVDGGVALWVNLGRPVSSQLALAARAQGLLLPAGPRFGIDGAFERFLRIPFCYGPDEMPRALEALAQAWQSLLAHPMPDTGYLADVV